MTIVSLYAHQLLAVLSLPYRDGGEKMERTMESYIDSIGAVYIGLHERTQRES